MNTIDYEIQTDTPVSDNLKEKINKALEIILTIHQIPNPVEVSISFLPAEEVKKLNKEYRKIDKTTDVLSFPIYESLESIPKDNPETPILLGDVILNPERASSQALEYGNSFEDECLYLTIHSFLHLLGYDHMIDEDKKEMRAQEKAVLKELKL